MSGRSKRAQIARETVRILSDGCYLAPSGRRVEIGPQLETATRNTVLYAPERFDETRSARDQRLADLRSAPPVAFEVTNESTLHAARRLVQGHAGADVLALNFASAKNPGGGFLNGAQAQEESLARASALYACLTTESRYYEANRACGTCLYTDHMIYAPRVPIFHDDDDRLLETPYTVSFLTAPAVNAGAVRRNELQNVERIETVMLRRIERLLSVALAHGHTALVLGAWGCGVFQNDSGQVAAWFGRYLTGDGLFARAFERVVFAVLDRSPDGATIRPFERVFQSGASSS